jgi:hypothetical protein
LAFAVIRIRERVVGIPSVAVLLCRIVEQSATACGIHRIILGTAGAFIHAQQGLGHRQFGDEGTGDRPTIRNSRTRDIHRAFFFGNVLAVSPSVQGLVEGAQAGFVVDASGVASWRVELSAGWEDHV